MSTGPVNAAFLAQSRVPQILIGTILPAGIASVFVFARFYSRAVIMRNWGVDDTFILISWIVGGVILTVLNCVMTRYGIGHHMQAVENSQGPIIGMKIGFACRIFYQLSLMTTKIAICLFYRRIFQERRSKIFVWVMIGLISAFSIPIIFTVVFSCKPIEGAWTFVPSKCLDNTPSIYASTIFNIIVDVLLLIFVVPKIVALQITRTQKASLLAIVCTSVVVIVASIIRLDRTLVTQSSTDMPWDTYNIAIWSAVEVNTGLICASAAAIKPLLRRITPRTLSSLHSSNWQITTKTNTSMGTYGAGTQHSRSHTTDDAIELGSQTDMEIFAGNSTTVNKFWANREQGNMSDNDSEAGVLGLDANRSEILKTVSVSVTESNGDLGISRHNSDGKLEHV